VNAYEVNAFFRALCRAAACRRAAVQSGDSTSRRHGHVARRPRSGCTGARPVHGRTPPVRGRTPPAHGKMGSRRTTRPHRSTAAPQHGRAAGGCAARRPHWEMAAARQHSGEISRQMLTAKLPRGGETAARRNIRRDGGETATARRDSDRESECLVSRAVAAPRGEMGSRPTARPHGRTAMQRDGRAADAWPQAVHRPCTVWRGAQRDSRAAQAGGCEARRPHGELAARPLPGGRPHGETAAGARWLRGEMAARRDAMKAVAAAAFGGGLSPNSETAGTVPSQPRSCRTCKRIQSTVKFERECCARGAGQAASFGGSDWCHWVDRSSSLLLHYHIHVQVLSSRS
jgi:hypothetical protein